MARGSCLCGDVAWEAAGPFAWMSHCHCSRCRKSHGTAFATYVSAPAAGFRWLAGNDTVRGYETSPGFSRRFCGRCGSTVPGGAYEGLVFVPAGSLDGDLGVKPAAHIFVGSKAPWWEIADATPQHDTYPAAVAAPVLPDLDRKPSAGPPQGSCLCGGIGYAVEGKPVGAWNCHCGRCRKARGSGFASNLFVPADGLRFVRGEDRLSCHKVADAQFFTQFFCRDCGAKMPRIDRDRGFAVVPMGSLDDDPGVRPRAHIFVASKADWDEISDALPQHAAAPPRG